ncbi:armadillo repeat-containing protein 6 isoform X2 [Protopterus annectens]|uniref:armadillo repeat-containing protein 6 isoform X2 n=1 Tax=Protopterus annectens TaxID=7888 RepID=UPI001CFAE6D7|nr:armadillo repeat-containing protein 6 isoform X2 [Protopterus annectens]
MLFTEVYVICTTLDAVKKSIDSLSQTEVKQHLAIFSDQCRTEFAYRYLAAQNSAYPVILTAWKLSVGDKNTLTKALSAMAALTDGQPDLLDAVGQQLLIETMQENADSSEVTQLALRIVRHVCLKHEQNRQDLVKAGVLPLLVGAITKHAFEEEIVKEACSAVRVMTLDDDIRVPFGHAHDHAKMIVLENNGLKVIIEAAKAFSENASVLGEICATLSRLAVRNEFCQDIVDLGGLNFMVALLADSIGCQELVKQVLSAIRAVAGNDDVKDAIVNSGGADLIVQAVNRHHASPQICDQGCAALSMLALRKPENCKVIMEGGGALTALQAMKVHPKDVNVQKQACVLLRNLVSRNPDYCQPILEMGAETLIIQARNAHRDCDDVSKAALRDLGCKVELRELWTGQKGSLAN